MKNYVYNFGNGKADGDGKMKDVLGGKGAGLAEMSRAGVPVPPGFTISTEVCNIYFEHGKQVPGEINNQILHALGQLEAQIGKKLGDPDNPLLVSVRSGAKFSMPGMMNTILNLGLNDKTVEGLVKRTHNPRFAYDCYRRFIQMFGEVALDIDMAKFDHIFDQRKHKAKAKLDTDLNAADLQAIIEQYKNMVQKETKKPFPKTRANSFPCRATRCSARGGIRKPAITARWKKFRTISARPRTCRPWCSAIWAIRPPPASVSRAIPPPVRRFSTANF